jgi:hypothetical protein
MGINKVSKPRSEVQVVKPKDEQQLKLIHRTIERVLTHGEQFEVSRVLYYDDIDIAMILVFIFSDLGVYYPARMEQSSLQVSCR